ncbi:CocE/NonD family hydrolase C-terminal non-catalytic domain-containing protein, partial [Gemmiger formicilis]
KIRTTKLSNCFRKGHRIRVTVTSSAKNFIFPNSNTREGFASARTVVAHNRVYHGGLHASRLTVRVEP